MWRAVYDLEEKKYHYHNHEFSCSAAVYDNDAAKGKSVWTYTDGNPACRFRLLTCDPYGNTHGVSCTNKTAAIPNLDLFRFLSSIIIIVLHVRPFFTVSYEIDMAINNIIGRICVPFFFFISGYFAAKQEQKKPDYIRSYIRSMIPVYLLWSAVYLPWSLSLAAPYIQQVSGLLCTIGLPTAIQNLLLLLLVPLAVIVALLYSGVYYHLWYFPALLLSMLVLRWWKRKYSLRGLLTVSFVLLLFGATETYYGFCGQFFQSLLHYYYAVFFTTRNFLFFALFYVTLGYWMGKQEQPASSLCFLKLLLSIAALVGEGMLLQTTQRLDSNILLACVPLVYYLFSCLLYTNIHVPQLSEIPFRAISKYYYLVHPLMILFVHAWFPQVDSFWMAVAKVVCVLCCTHICTLLLIHMKKRYPAVPL